MYLSFIWDKSNKNIHSWVSQECSGLWQWQNYFKHFLWHNSRAWKPVDSGIIKQDNSQTNAGVTLNSDFVEKWPRVISERIIAQFLTLKSDPGLLINDPTIMKNWPVKCWSTVVGQYFNIKNWS